MADMDHDYTPPLLIEGMPQAKTARRKKLFAALGSQPIEARASIVFAQAPFGGDPAFLFHAMKRGIEGAFFNAQDVIGDALDVEGYAPAMHGPLLKALQDQECQGALQIVSLGSNHFPISPRYL